MNVESTNHVILLKQSSSGQWTIVHSPSGLVCKVDQRVSQAGDCQTMVVGSWDQDKVVLSQCHTISMLDASGLVLVARMSMANSDVTLVIVDHGSNVPTMVNLSVYKKACTIKRLFLICIFRCAERRRAPSLSCRVHFGELARLLRCQFGRWFQHQDPDQARQSKRSKSRQCPILLLVQRPQV